MQPLDITTLQSGALGLQDALRMQQGLPWKHSLQTATRQLTRLTLLTEDSSTAAQAFSGAHAAAASFDLLAIQPMSDRVLQQVCNLTLITFCQAVAADATLACGQMSPAVQILFALLLRHDMQMLQNVYPLTASSVGFRHVHPWQ